MSVQLDKDLSLYQVAHSYRYLHKTEHSDLTYYLTSHTTKYKQWSLSYCTCKVMLHKHLANLLLHALANLLLHAFNYSLHLSVVSYTWTYTVILAITVRFCQGALLARIEGIATWHSSPLLLHLASSVQAYLLRPSALALAFGFSGSISGSVLSGSLGQKESSSPVTLSSVASSTTRQTAVGDSHLASIFTWKKQFIFRFSGTIISYVTSVSFVDGIWTLPFC